MPRLRLISALVLLILVASLLAACGGGAPETATTPPPATQAAAAPAPTAAPAAVPTAAPAAVPTTAPTAAPAAAPTTAPAAASGGTIRIGRTAAPDSLNPGQAYLSEAYDLFLLVYDTLITTDLRGKAQPQLAKEWSVGADGKTWTFKLHEGVKWHDGQPLTSEDVAFTFDMIQKVDTFSTIKSYTSLISKVEAPDPTTVVITFEQPVANTDERFSGIFILPNISGRSSITTPKP